MAPEQRASVLYTSGSTGHPKGAMTTHEGLCNHLEAKIRDLALGADDVLAQTASQSFVISVWQLLAPLAVGGRVHIVAQAVAQARAAVAVRRRRTVTPVMARAKRKNGCVTRIFAMKWRRT